MEIATVAGIRGSDGTFHTLVHAVDGREVWIGARPSLVVNGDPFGVPSRVPAAIAAGAEAEAVRRFGPVPSLTDFDAVADWIERACKTQEGR